MSRCTFSALQCNAFSRVIEAVCSDLPLSIFRRLFRAASVSCLLFIFRAFAVAQTFVSHAYFDWSLTERRSSGPWMRMEVASMKRKAQDGSSSSSSTACPLSRSTNVGVTDGPPRPFLGAIPHTLSPSPPPHSPLRRLSRLRPPSAQPILFAVAPSAAPSCRSWPPVVSPYRHCCATMPLHLRSPVPLTPRPR